MKGPGFQPDARALLPRRQDAHPRSGQLRRALAGGVLLLGCCLPTHAYAVDREAMFRVQLKKINQYLDDKFCVDALSLAQETLQKEGGAERFDVREAIARSQLCLGSVLETLATLDETEQRIPVTPEERGRLNQLRDQVRAQFGELKLRFPGGRRDKVRVTLTQVGELANPELAPFVTQVEAILASGSLTIPDARLFLPRGTYRIDAISFEIRDFEGVTFVIGRERPSPPQRLSLGDGQALGVGYLSLTGWQGDSLPIQQLSGGSQEVIGVDRLGTTASAFLELSTTRAWQWGTLGYVGLRLDLQWRPGVALPGDVVSDGLPGLNPAWGALGASLQRQLPVKGGWSVSYGGGARVLRYDWLEYLAIVALEDPDGGGASGTTDPYSGETTNISRMPVYMPTWGGGLEVMAASQWQVRAGKQPMQVGLELRAGLAGLVPTQQEGQETLDTGSGSVILSWRLYQERLWGSYVGGVVTVRMPLF